MKNYFYSDTAVIFAQKDGFFSNTSYAMVDFESKSLPSLGSFSFCQRSRINFFRGSFFAVFSYATSADDNNFFACEYSAPLA